MLLCHSSLLRRKRSNYEFEIRIVCILDVEVYTTNFFFTLNLLVIRICTKATELLSKEKIRENKTKNNRLYMGHSINFF